MIYEGPKRDALLVVPNEVSALIDRRLDAAIAANPDAQKDREHLRNCLLGVWDEYGYIPDFDLAKREPE